MLGLQDTPEINYVTERLIWKVRLGARLKAFWDQIFEVDFGRFEDNPIW